MFGIVTVIPNTGIETVGKEDNRSAPKLLFQQVSIQFSLLPSDGNIFAGALCFNNGQGLAIVTKQHIICIANFGLVGHARKFIFIVPILAQHPTSIYEHGINIDLACLKLGNIQRLGNIGLGLLLAFLRQFFLQSFVLCNQLLNIHIQVWLGSSGSLLLGQ